MGKNPRFIAINHDRDSVLFISILHRWTPLALHISCAFVLDPSRGATACSGAPKSRCLT